MTGAPGRTTWVRAIPARASAFCSTSAPASVTGAIAPASVNGVMQITWLRAEILEDPVEHRRVEPERRRRVDDGEDRRLAVEGRLVDAAGDPGHLERVEVPLPAEAVGVERLVGEGHHVVDRVEVADRRVDVDRLDRVAGEEVDRVEHLEEPDEVLVVGPVADPPAAVEVGDVRRAATVPKAVQSPPIGGRARGSARGG